MDPWVAIVLLGAVIFGFAWLIPSRQAEGARGGSDPAYEQLLEELETENRELLDAVAKFKQEQDQTIQNMARQMGDLQRQIQAMAAEQAAAKRMPPASSAQVPSADEAAVAAVAPSTPSAVSPAATSDPSPEQHPSTADPVILPTSIRERYAGLLNLHRKGKSIEQIAKSSGMNKGEVQLILQLARREEEQLA